MIIKSIKGKTLYKSSRKSLRSALEDCARKGIDISGANLRRAALSGARLDGLKAQGACFWGADLAGADLAASDLSGADLRAANLKDCCLSGSHMNGADLSGAYFSQTLFAGAVLEKAIITCPSFWNCDLHLAKSLKGLRYCHLGESEVILKTSPLVVRDATRRIVAGQDFCLWGNFMVRDAAKPHAECE